MLYQGAASNEEDGEGGAVIVSTSSSSTVEKKRLREMSTEEDPLMGREFDKNHREQYLFHRIKQQFRKIRPHLKQIKIGILVVVLILGIAAFASTDEPEVDSLFAVSSDYPLTISLNDDYPKAFVQLRASSIPSSSLDSGSYSTTTASENTVYNITINLQQQTDETSWSTLDSKNLIFNNATYSVDSKSTLNRNNNVALKALHRSISSKTRYPVYSIPRLSKLMSSSSLSSSSSSSADESVTVEVIWELPDSKSHYRLFVYTNSPAPVPLEIELRQHSSAYRYKEFLAALVLIGMYILIVFEIIDRTLSAILGSFMILAMLALVKARPPLDVIVTWIEYNTLALLFGMMLIVGIFSTTGFFEWIALKAYDVSKGRLWRLVALLCVFTAVASGVLDNVTSMLLLTPVVIRLCKVIGVSPIPVLICTVTISNIGGCSTAVGDPPMTIIVNTPGIISAGIDFVEVFLYMAPGTAVIVVAALFFYRWYFKKEFEQDSSPVPAASLLLQKELDIWRSTEKKLSSNIPEEREVKQMLEDYMFQLQTKIQEDALDRERSGSMDNFNMQQLKEEYKITDRTLFIYCSIVMTVVVTMFFLENFIKAWVIYHCHGYLCWVPLLLWCWLILKILNICFIRWNGER
eukprot:TRINITY_DN4828_c0_g3_i1.p1 TRINITY_DN4828_c0_g3~~TRINITY_DN4828_c0_g3_i1.p1  ORF type:complete len:634 (-),score=139.54 TRINITY_DN4828_c0_g3_i1:391-2292(-)